MSLWLDLKGPITADSVRRNGVLVGKDVDFSLPAVTYLTAEFRAMGNVTLPILGMIEAMELTISKIGVDDGFAAMLTPGSAGHEYRWIQTVTNADGNTTEEGCKAFVRCVPKAALPSISLSIGSPLENELAFAVTRYQLVVAGKEFCLIDPLAGILRINGVDHLKNRSSLL